MFGAVFYTILYVSSRVKAAAILDVVRSEPQFTDLASIIAGTGGGIPNPDIEDRFNGARNKQSLSLFAPVNAAFSKVPKPVLVQFSIPQNYPLLLSILRTHFVEGHYNQSTLPLRGQKLKVQSVEGYSIPISSDGKGYAHIDNQYYTSNVNSSAINTENGIIYAIDRLIDPFASTFGVSDTNGSGHATIIDSSSIQVDKTMTDLALAEPQVSQWVTLIREVLPAIMKRLGDRRGPEGVACTTPHPFAVLPTNNAFSYLPANYIKVLRAPFNFALSSHLLAWGISVPTCATFQDIMAAVRTQGEFKIFSHRADMNLTITETPKGSGELMVNNARVVMANRCAGNGCIWMVDRLIDPVFGMF